MTPLPSDGYHHPKLIHPVPADAYFYCRFSAFRHYAAAYSEELLDRLALFTQSHHALRDGIHLLADAVHSVGRLLRRLLPGE
jgi:hypothetical protein